MGMDNYFIDIGAMVIIGIDKNDPAAAPVSAVDRHQVHALATPNSFGAGQRDCGQQIAGSGINALLRKQLLKTWCGKQHDDGSDGSGD